MQTYEEIINSGDYAPNLIAGDLNSNLIRMINREEIEAGRPMPPTKALKEEWIDIIERWVVAGMPETLEDLPGTPEVPIASPSPESTPTP